jgi:ubiquinone/menaquinone biosynthesis C-methylase UbiE
MQPAARLYGVYDWIVERPEVARLGGRLLWGADTTLFYGAHAAIAEAPAGGTVLDVPCGGGVAFRSLPAGRDLRYIAADLDERQLDRARAEARRRGATGIEFVRADVGALPLDDDSVDLCLTSAGLHCFPEPAGALTEIARCLRPGGRLVATMVVRGAGARQDAAIALYQRIGIFGPGGTAQDYRAWALAAGFAEVRLERSGALARMDAWWRAPKRRGTS